MLRTLALNLPFVAGLAWFAPNLALTAAATRGDWMLEDLDQPWARTARGWLVAAGDVVQRFNGDFADNPWEALAETDTDRVPDVPEVEVTPDVPAPVPAPPPTVAVTVRVPSGATVQVRHDMLAADTTVELPAGEAVPVAVTFADQRKLGCTLAAGAAREVSFAEADGRWTLEGQLCEELRAADPSWRPELRMETRRIGEWITSVLPELGIAPDDAPRVLAARGSQPDEVLMRAPDGTWAVLGPRSSPRRRAARAPRHPLPAARAHRRGQGRVLRRDHRPGRPPVRRRGRGEAAVRPPGQRGAVHRLRRARDGRSRRPTRLGDPGDPRRGCRRGRVARPGPIRTRWRRRWRRSSPSTRWAATSPRSPTATSTLRACVHDWIALHVAYDVDSLVPGQRKPQDADTVYRSGLGVCAGYANLFVALARSAGLDAAYLTGNVRSEDGDIAGSSHAWNAVKIDGHWALLNVTWDAGVVEDGRFEAEYRTAYLSPRRRCSGSTTSPNTTPGSSTRRPISRGAFIRQPNVTPSFHAAGLTLVSWIGRRST